MKLFSKKDISTYPDEDLIPLIVKKNEQAFEEIYKRYAKRMHYFFYMRLNYDKDLASDLLQELFIKFLHKAATFDVKQQFSTWFFTMANNNCKNEYKRSVHHLDCLTESEKNTLIDSAMSPESDFEALFYAEFKVELEKELSQLKVTHRTAFVLKHKENLTIKEIAQVMECSEGTIKSRLFYTVNKLAKALAKFNTLNGIK